VRAGGHRDARRHRVPGRLRIFDSVYIISAGNNPNVETVSVLDFNELLTRLNLGVGSAISVLIFLFVVLIAFIFVKGLGTSLAQQRGEY
jgi:multiple sugar transport system permease protein